MKRTLIILGLILISFGLSSCGGGGPTDTSNYGPGVLFVETWESYPVGSFPGGGWQDYDSIPYFEKEVNISSNHKLLLHGPSTESGYGMGGIYYNFKPGTMKPSYIHYKVHPYPDYHEIQREASNYDSIGHFWIGGYNDENIHLKTGIHVSISLDSYGNGYIRGNLARFPEEVYNKVPLDNSFRIELKNIHWESTPMTYDFWVNGVEIETCVSFENSIESIATMMVFNSHYGRVHFDDIYMADLPVEYHCPVVSDNPPGPDTMPLPPQPSPTEPIDPVLFIFELLAFCRGGPSTEYPKISTFPEGTQLEITGQNIEGSWWWSDGEGCWVSDSVGELVGDKTTLDIIIPPPPPDDSDSSDGSHGKPAGCKKSLGQAACLEEGGSWDDQPGQPGTCVCP